MIDMATLKVLTVLIGVFGFRLVAASELCLVGDFDAQFSYLLESQMLTDEQVSQRTEVCGDVETILNTVWPGTVVTAFGSLATGLGLKASDVDCLAAVPRRGPRDSDRHIVINTTALFLRQPHVYQQLIPKITFRVPIMTFFYAPAQTYCDLSFRGPTGIENSKLVNHYMLMDERVRNVTAFLKFWSQVHHLTGSAMLPSYGLALMSIFYFQQRGIVPSTYYLQSDAEPRFVIDWNNGFDRLPYENNNTESIYELLHGFFKYYSEFNYDDYIISVYAGRPVAKSLFVDVDTVPEEFVLYEYLVRKGSFEPAMFKGIWIQDAFEHDSNLADRRDPLLAARLLDHVRHALEMFEELPRDELFRALLVRHEPHVSRKKNIVLDTVSRDRNCARA